jgi:hypothetical protein
MNRGGAGNSVKKLHRQGRQGRPGKIILDFPLRPSRTPQGGIEQNPLRSKIFVFSRRPGVAAVSSYG